MDDELDRPDILDDSLDDDDDDLLEGPEGGGRRERGRRLDADAILDTLVPSTIDWRETVRRHPFASVTCVSLVGYLVGRSKGATIMSGVSTGLSAALMRQLGDVFEGDFFDF